MKRLKSLMAVLLCTTIILAGCHKNQIGNKEETVSIQLYNDAVAAIQQQGSYTLNIQKDKTTTIGDNVTTETVIQTITYLNLYEDNFIASVTETISVNDDTLKLKYSYTQNRAEVSIGNRVYGVETTAEDFISHFTPAVLLDSSLYKSTETSQSDGITMFSFSEATAPEQWAIPANAAIIDAHGNATLDNEGNLISSSYHISYTNGPASVLDKTTVTISPSTEISYIDDVESTSITSIFAPEQLEIACMYLKNAGDISSEIVHIVQSEAFSIEREQTTQLSLTGSGESLAVDITATTTQQSISKKSEPTVLSQNIHFRNGKYTVSADEGEAITADVSWEQMQKYCSSLLTENIPIIDQLTAIESEYAEDNLLIKFHTTDYLSDRICEQISNILYGDSAFISGISSEVVTTGATGYIAIDLQTGLPSSSGIFYETTHSIDGNDYKLSSQIEQKYSIAK